VGTFGWVLWLIQQKRRKETDFRDVLHQVVTRVDQLPASERVGWEQLLWFAHALVYPARETPPRERLADFIRATVRQAKQAEAEIMGKTSAEALRNKALWKARPPVSSKANATRCCGCCG
jgi:hypothetical protein